MSFLRWTSYRETDDGPTEPVHAVGNGVVGEDQRVMDPVRPPIRSPCHLVGWEGCVRLPASIPDATINSPPTAVAIPGPDGAKEVATTYPTGTDGCEWQRDAL